MTSTEPGRSRLEKHRWIAGLVPSRTFADVGGLGGTVNETVFNVRIEKTWVSPHGSASVLARLGAAA